MKYKFKTEPYQHQLDALETSWNRETYAYFMEMGTGKTKVLIDNMSMLYDRGKIDGALITLDELAKNLGEEHEEQHEKIETENLTNED